MTTATRFEKAISYDRETGDFELRLDGDIVGYARSYYEGELRLNEVVHSILSHQAERVEESAPEPLDVVCELCGSPAVLVGEQFVCPECSPVYAAPAEAACCKHCGEAMDAPANVALVSGAPWCSGCLSDNAARLARMGGHYVLMDAAPSIVTVALPAAA